MHAIHSTPDSNALNDSLLQQIKRCQTHLQVQWLRLVEYLLLARRFCLRRNKFMLEQHHELINFNIVALIDLYVRSIMP